MLTIMYRKAKDRVKKEKEEKKDPHTIDTHQV